MWYRSYRDHVIMAFPSFDTATGLWAPQANIAWVDGQSRKSHFVRFTERVMTEDDAVASASAASDAWIDRRLTGARELQPAVGTSPLRPDSAAPLARAVKSPKNTPRILTYGQFKALMDKSGFDVSEQSLQKSYAALVQLRKQNHHSWSQIILKMKHSQDGWPAVNPKALKTKPARLPLTLRDWRRVF